MQPDTQQRVSYRCNPLNGNVGAFAGLLTVRILRRQIKIVKQNQILPGAIVLPAAADKRAEPTPGSIDFVSSTPVGPSDGNETVPFGPGAGMKNSIIAALSLLAVFCLGLYLHEMVKQPQVVEKTVTVERRVEVPKEIIKKVPVEVIKEVPAKIPDNYLQALDIFEKLNNPKYVMNDNELLQGVKSINLVISLGDKAHELVDVSILRTKLEFAVRRNGIAIDEKSPWLLKYAIDGLAMKAGSGNETRQLVFSMNLSLFEAVSILGPDGSKVTIVPVWTRGTYGNVTYNDASAYLAEQALHRIDEFSNAWLTQNSR